MFTFKKDGKDILKDLKNAGFSSYVLRDRKLLSEVSIQHLRRNEMISSDALNAICCMLRKNITEIIEWKITDEEKLKYF